MKLPSNVLQQTLPFADDRAEGLHRGSPLAVAKPTRRMILAVGGGKGGVGKSLLSANLGVTFAEAGRAVVLVDADLGGANLHTCLGLPPPKKTLSDFVNHQVAELSDVLVPTHLHNLKLISGAHDALDAANPKHTEKLRLLREVARLDVDQIIIDLGGGTGFNILDFFALADHGLLVALPEPTSVENVYRFIKATCLRRLKGVAAERGFAAAFNEVLIQAGPRATPSDVIASLAAHAPACAEPMRAALQQTRLSLVINQARTANEIALGHAMQDACRRFFGVHVGYLGAIPYDDAVWQAVRRRRPVVLDTPASPASQSLRNLAHALSHARS